MRLRSPGSKGTRAEQNGQQAKEQGTKGLSGCHIKVLQDLEVKVLHLKTFP